MPNHPTIDELNTLTPQALQASKTRAFETHYDSNGNLIITLTPKWKANLNP